MATIAQIVGEIHARAAGKTAKEYRLLREFPIGAVLRQGDVYVMRVKSVKGAPAPNRQLAPGNSKGSRHIVEGDVQMLTGWDAPKTLFADAAQVLRVPRERLCSVLAGPAIVSEGAFRVTHPEHADCTLPGGSYITWGQLDPRTMRRVQD